MKNGIKGLVLLAMAFFLFSRITNGTLFFYINNRFAWLTFMAVIGFFLVAVGYLAQTPQVQAMRKGAGEQDHDGHEHHDHDHHSGDDHQHAHNLTRVGLALVMLPIVLGTLVPPRPLGASAIDNREVTVGRLNSAVAPKESTVASSTRERNLLDWLMAFDTEPDPAVFAGQEAKVLGFVYRDGRFGDDIFMISRFIVSCCVADATPVGLIVRWPESGTLERDQWVEVSGKFEAGEFDGKPTAVLAAEQLTPTDMPNQPYLFP